MRNGSMSMLPRFTRIKERLATQVKQERLLALPLELRRLLDAITFLVVIAISFAVSICMRGAMLRI